MTVLLRRCALESAQVRCKNKYIFPSERSPPSQLITHLPILCTEKRRIVTLNIAFQCSI